jgi:hypothetical protein
MKTRVIQDEPEAPTSPQVPSQPRMSGGRIALLVAGALALLGGLVLLVGGIGLIVVNETETNSAGYFSTAKESYATESHAIVSDTLDVGTDGPDWLFEEGRLATLRLEGSSVDPSSELFIGIGPTADVREYLAGASYDTVIDIDFDPFRATYDATTGGATPDVPGGQALWGASTSGSGSRTLEWEVAKGDWSVVVMNGDASRGVDVRLSLGAKVGFIFWLGLGLMIAGAVLLAGGAALTYLATRRPRVPAAAAPAPAS